MAKIRVRKQATHDLYPHNDMRQAAQHHKDRVEARLAANDMKGIAYDMLAEFVFLAFAVEAQVNFFGAKLVPCWRESDRFDDKFKQVLKHFKLKVDWNKRPFATARTLQQVRNGLAHGKPIRRVVDKIEVIDEETSDDVSFSHFKRDWEVHCTPTFYQEAHEDVGLIWTRMLAASGLNQFDTMTGGSGLTKYLGPADAEE